MTDLKKRFGEQLRGLRIAKNLTQEKLSASVGVSVEFLSNMERGINAPSFQTLEKLAQSLEIPVKELFNFEEE